MKGLLCKAIGEKIRLNIIDEWFEDMSSSKRNKIKYFFVSYDNYILYKRLFLTDAANVKWHNKHELKALPKSAFIT